MIAVSAQVPQGPILYAPHEAATVAAQTTAVNEKAKDYCKFAGHTSVQYSAPG